MSAVPSLLSCIGALLGVPAVAYITACIRTSRKRYYPSQYTLSDPLWVPPDHQQCAEPWLRQLQNLGFEVAHLLRIDHPHLAEGFRWIACQNSCSTWLTLDRLIPLSGDSPRFELTLYSASPDGSLWVTSGHHIPFAHPPYWNLLSQPLFRIDDLVQSHLDRLPPRHQLRQLDPNTLPSLLEADAEATRKAWIEHRSHEQDPDNPRSLRLVRNRWLHLPLEWRKATRPPFTTPAPPAGLILSEKPSATPPPPSDARLNESTERDLIRFRKRSAIRESSAEYARRLTFLALLTTAVTLLFGKEEPIRFAWLFLAIHTFHQAGHWLAMRIFRFRNLSSLPTHLFLRRLFPAKPEAPAWQHIIVSFAGPLPGLLLGLAILCSTFTHPNLLPSLLDAAGLAMAYNGIQLLPIIPLDGGKIIDRLIGNHRSIIHRLLHAPASLIASLGTLASRIPFLSRPLTSIFGHTLWDQPSSATARACQSVKADPGADEAEITRRILRTAREKGHTTFFFLPHWHRRIHAIIQDRMHTPGSFASRLTTITIYLITCLLPLTFIATLLIIPFLGNAERFIGSHQHTLEFKRFFPQTPPSPVNPDVSQLVEQTLHLTKTSHGELPSLTANGRRRDLASQLIPELGPKLDSLSWPDTAHAFHQNLIPDTCLALWLEILTRQVEYAAITESHAEAIQRSKHLLSLLPLLEPSPSLAFREHLWNTEVRTLHIIEREAALGKLHHHTLLELTTSIQKLHHTPQPEVENFLLVQAWSDHQRASAIQRAQKESKLDIRFWRDLYPRVQRLKDQFDSRNDDPLTPAVVSLARYWRSSHRVGELPPVLDGRLSVGKSDTAFILGFCERHRRMSWQRLSTLSALTLEDHRLRTGKFPPLWRHSIPGGAFIEMIDDDGPWLRLTDLREPSQRRAPAWLVNPRFEDPPATPPIRILCPLFGARSIPSVSQATPTSRRH